MMARPITLEKPLKAKERRRLENNGEVRTPSHAPSHAPPPPPNSNNDRKISSRSADGYDDQRNNGASRRHQSASAIERQTALDKILNSADVATDVDTGHSVFVHEERQRNNAVPPSARNTR
jgi:hypothetical protein